MEGGNCPQSSIKKESPSAGGIDTPSFVIRGCRRPFLSCVAEAWLLTYKQYFPLAFLFFFFFFFNIIQLLCRSSFAFYLYGFLDHHQLLFNSAPKHFPLSKSPLPLLLTQHTISIATHFIDRTLSFRDAIHSRTGLTGLHLHCLCHPFLPMCWFC